MTEAYVAVGGKKRVRLLPEKFRKYCCGRYQHLRERGLSHGEARLMIECEPEYQSLPLWAVLLAQVLIYLLQQWWESRSRAKA